MPGRQKEKQEEMVTRQGKKNQKGGEDLHPVLQRGLENICRVARSGVVGSSTSGRLWPACREPRRKRRLGECELVSEARGDLVVAGNEVGMQGQGR